MPLVARAARLACRPRRRCCSQRISAADEVLQLRGAFDKLRNAISSWSKHPELSRRRLPAGILCTRVCRMFTKYSHDAGDPLPAWGTLCGSIRRWWGPCTPSRTPLMLLRFGGRLRSSGPCRPCNPQMRTECLRRIWCTPCGERLGDVPPVLHRWVRETLHPSLSPAARDLRPGAGGEKFA